MQNDLGSYEISENSLNSAQVPRIFSRSALAFVKYTQMIERDRERAIIVYNNTSFERKSKNNDCYEKVHTLEACVKVPKILGGHFPRKSYKIKAAPEYYWLLKTDKCLNLLKQLLNLSLSVQDYHQTRVLEVKIPKCTNTWIGSISNYIPNYRQWNSK